MWRKHHILEWYKCHGMGDFPWQHICEWICIQYHHSSPWAMTHCSCSTNALIWANSHDNVYVIEDVYETIIVHHGQWLIVHVDILMVIMWKLHQHTLWRMTHVYIHENAHNIHITNMVLIWMVVQTSRSWVSNFVGPSWSGCLMH